MIGTLQRQLEATKRYCAEKQQMPLNWEVTEDRQEQRLETEHWPNAGPSNFSP